MASAIRRTRWLAALVFGLLIPAVVHAQEQSDSAPAVPPASEGKIATPLRVRVSSGVMAGLIRKKVAPQYPPDAREAGIQGTVILKALVSKNGDVSDLQPISGDPALTEAAMKAVRKWKYRPYLLNGQPIEVESTVQVNFTLSYR